MYKKIAGNSSVEKVSVKNTMNPILWVCGISVTLGFVYLLYRDPTPPIFYYILGFMFAPVVLFIVAYLYFMFKDPDKLQSEDYQLSKQALGIIEEKGVPAKVGTIELYSNPELPKPTIVVEEEG